MSLLEVKNLHTYFKTRNGTVKAVNDVSYSIERGKTLGIVGESGCGKSMLCKTIMKLLPKSARIEGGRILANGVDITDYSDKDMRKLRGKLFSFVFQDPMTALNPTIPIGKQIAEAIRRIDVAENFNYLDGIIRFLLQSLQTEYQLELNNLIARAYEKKDPEKFETYCWWYEREFLAPETLDKDEILSLDFDGVDIADVRVNINLHRQKAKAQICLFRTPLT